MQNKSTAARKLLKYSPKLLNLAFEATVCWPKKQASTRCGRQCTGVLANIWPRDQGQWLGRAGKCICEIMKPEQTWPKHRYGGACGQAVLGERACLWIRSAITIWLIDLLAMHKGTSQAKNFPLHLCVCGWVWRARASVQLIWSTIAATRRTFW